MKSTVSKISTKMRNLMIPTLIVGLIGTSYFIQKMSQNGQGITTVNDGLQTCFARINQSYVAKLIGQGGSNYLKSEFTAVTEECLSDVVAVSDEKFASLMDSTIKKLNALARDTHWFHEKLLSTSIAEINESAEIQGVLASQFSTLEKIKDTVVDANLGLKANFERIQGWLKTALGFCAFMLPMLLIALVQDNRREHAMKRAIENEAEAELAAMSETTPERVEQIISTALLQNSLVSCARLFTQFHTDLIGNRLKSYFNESDKSVKQENAELVKELVTPDLIVSTKKEVQAAHDEQLAKVIQEPSIKVSESFVTPKDIVKEVPQITKVENVEATPVEAEASLEMGMVNLEMVVGQTISLMAKKIFTSGVFVDLGIDEDVNISAQDEALRQILFQLISYAVESSKNAPFEKKISLRARELGDCIILRITTSGEGFSDSFISSQHGTLPEQDDLGAGLNACRELARMINGDISYANILGPNGDITGEEIKVFLRSAQSAKAEASEDKSEVMAAEDSKQMPPLPSRLVQISKGTKRDILQQFAQF